MKVDFVNYSSGGMGFQFMPETKMEADLLKCLIKEGNFEIKTGSPCRDEVSDVGVYMEWLPKNEWYKKDAAIRALKTIKDEGLKRKDHFLQNVAGDALEYLK